MTSITTSRRGVIAALVTLPVIAVPAIAAATPRPAHEGDDTMNMHTTICSQSARSQEWAICLSAYRAARVEWLRAVEISSAADDARVPYSEPRPDSPKGASDHPDFMNMTLQQIRDFPGDPAAWADYERAKAEWDAAEEAWEERQVGEATAIYHAAHEAFQAAIGTLVACRVHSLHNLTEKLAMAPILFGGLDGDSTEEEHIATYHAVLHEDARAMTGVPA